MFEAVQLLMWKHAGETGGEVPTTSQGCVLFFTLLVGGCGGCGGCVFI